MVIARKHGLVNMRSQGFILQLKTQTGTVQLSLQKVCNMHLYPFGPSMSIAACLLVGRVDATRLAIGRRH